MIESHHHSPTIVVGKAVSGLLRLMMFSAEPRSCRNNWCPCFLNRGQPSDYPVLVAIRCSVTLKTNPESTVPGDVSEAACVAGAASFIRARFEVPDHRGGACEHSVTLRLRFDPPDGFDADDYPVRATLRAFARFNGFKTTTAIALA